MQFTKRNIIPVIIVIGIFLSVFLIHRLMANGGAKLENAKYVISDDSYISVNPKCPECGHLSMSEGYNLCKGESLENYNVCENCGEYYEFSIKR